MKKTKSRHRKVRFLNEKKKKKLMKKAYLYGLAKKPREKFMNQNSNFQELECEKSLNINQ